MKENKELDPNFIEDLTGAISDFELFMYENSYNSDTVINYTNILFSALKSSKSEYGVINNIIINSSSWGDLQRIFFMDFIHGLFIDAYLTEIDKDPKQMLYALSQNLVRLGNSFIGEMLNPLKEYARDQVILNVGGAFKPKFRREDPLNYNLKTANFKDIFIEDFEPEKIDEIFKYINSHSPTAKSVIPIFRALESFNIINGLYIEDYKNNYTSLGHFAGNVVRGKGFDKSIVQDWSPSTRNKGGVYEAVQEHIKEISKIINS